MTPDPSDPVVAVEEPPSGAPPAPGVQPDGPSGPGDPGGTGPGDPGGSDGSGGAADAKPRPTSRWIREGVIVVLVAVLVAVLLRTFVVQTFYIPSGSMEPTLQVGDRIIVNKLSYDLHGVDRGDIVVFSRPPAEDCGGPEVNDLVKRIIGLPGETISVARGYVYIDGRKLNETYLPKIELGNTNAGPGPAPYSLVHPYHIPANDYFVMGDNRTDSCDSRFWGPVAKNLIVGKVEMRVWPLSSIHFF